MNLNAIARSRCEKLIALAKEMYSEDSILAKRYVSLARKIAMRHRFSLGRRFFCRECDAIFIPGKTLKIRISPSQRRVLYTCLSCNTSASFPYAREKAKRKALRKNRVK